MNTEETIKFLEIITEKIRQRGVVNAEVAIDFDLITTHTQSGNTLTRQGPHRRIVLDWNYADVPDLQAGEERDAGIPLHLKCAFELKADLMIRKGRPDEDNS